MTLTDRPYQATDRDTCIALFGTNVPRFFHASEVRDFTEFLDASGRHYSLVFDGDEAVGCGGFSVGDEGQSACD